MEDGEVILRADFNNNEKSLGIKDMMMAKRNPKLSKSQKRRLKKMEVGLLCSSFVNVI